MNLATPASLLMSPHNRRTHFWTLGAYRLLSRSSSLPESLRGHESRALLVRGSQPQRPKHVPLQETG